MVTILSILFATPAIIASGLALDLLFNEGGGITNLINAYKGKVELPEPEPTILSTIQDLEGEMHDLYDDLAYAKSDPIDNDEDIEAIVNKIALKRTLLETLLAKIK